MRRLLLLGAGVAVFAGCTTGQPDRSPNTTLTAAEHLWFDIDAGVHAVDCNVCHGGFATFSQFTCFACHAHDQAPTDPLHAGLTQQCPGGQDAGYCYASAACYACHQQANGDAGTFQHTGIKGGCASCHDVGGPFAALPVPGFTHPPMNGSDCGACHNTVGWGGDGGVFDHSGIVGTCASCHGVGAPFAALPVAGFTHPSMNGSDCGACHNTRGWGGDAGAPPTIAVGAFPIPQPPATSSTHQPQAGIQNLPHPGTSPGCQACHGTGTPGNNAIGYDHASSRISAHCTACHEAGSDLIGTSWNGSTTQTGGAGDSRPFTFGTIAVSHGNGCTLNRTNAPGSANHFFQIDCDGCHAAPSGVATAKASAAYTAAWRFQHNQSVMPQAACNVCHGGQQPCGGG